MSYDPHTDRPMSEQDDLVAAADAQRERDETVTERIVRGELPQCLEVADGDTYRSFRHDPTWDGWLAAWRGIAWVRLQAFERDAEAEWAWEEDQRFSESRSGE